MIPDMEQFMVQCVETYLAAANKIRDSFKYAATPYLDEDRPVASDDAVNTGALQPIASSVLMKVLIRSKNGKIRSAQGSGQSCKERHKMECELRQKIAHIDHLLCKFFIEFTPKGLHRRFL